jgi:hypothetical protein
MKHIQLFEDFVNEGLFDFLKSDVIDFTKPDNTEDKKSFWKRSKKEPEVKPTPQRPYYGTQEEEEEEAPYKKVVRRSDDYWSDENVRIREARKRKIRTTPDTGQK